MTEEEESQAGPSTVSTTNTHTDKYPLNDQHGRKASKSVSTISSARPAVGWIAKRPKSCHPGSISPVNNVPTLFPLPEQTAIAAQPDRMGLKRRTSTPTLRAAAAELRNETEKSGKGRVVQTRARATSTSLVLPDATYIERSVDRPPTSRRQTLSVPPPTWIYPPPNLDSAIKDDEPTTLSNSVLTAVYNFGESSISRLGGLLRNTSRPGTLLRRQASQD
jgi:hypothetical protein